MRLVHGLSLLAVLGITAHPTTSAAAEPVWTAALRYRLENVDQSNFDRDALASTARLRLGVKKQLSEAVQVFVEGEAVWDINDHFNSGANGHTTYPSVPDATGIEMNQVGVNWKGERSDAVVGRQRILLDNQRFIGNSGWRQNEQTFDAAMVSFKPNTEWTLNYAYLDRVHRVSGDHARDPLARERNLDAHLLHANVTTPIGPVTGYVYAVEDDDVIRASSRTVGLRWTGLRNYQDWRWTGALEAARQNDYANNPLHFAHDYYLIEAGVGRGNVNAKLAREQLQGNGSHALQTPLATLHAFNGWADVFLATPANGLVDTYASISVSTPWKTAAPLEWTVAAHDYGPSRSGPDYGHEFDASVGTKFGHGWSGLLKFADYQSDGFAVDTRKIWLQVEWAK